MLRPVMTVRAAPRSFALALALVATACGADDLQPEGVESPSTRTAPPVRASTLAIQRRADGLEQVSLRGRPQHVTRAQAATDGGVAQQCASHAP